MCGIAGYFGFNDKNLLENFSRQLSHRGPDGEGYFFEDGIGLLNRRLAIIDLKTGNQPIYNEDRSIVVVYNGEIYNYRKLRNLLEKKGHQFKTQTDTEIIVHFYEEKGENCFDYFNGMFAIALYDRREKKLILVRDHFGIKPLYYAVINQKPACRQGRSKMKNQNGGKINLIFASEIKPIFYSGLIEKKPNEQVIYRYLKYRIHDDGEETFFEGVKRLLPGEMMIIQNSNLKVKSYTDLKKELGSLNKTKKINFQEIKQFKNQVIRAIRLRLISDVPIGSCLSGGIDSSTIVAVINQLLKEKIKETKVIGKIQKTFSAVFPASLNDEEKYVNELTKFIKLESYKVKPTPEEFFKDLEDFIKTQEEPTISTGPYAQYCVMRKASKYVKVLLDGQGSDEMMAGYLPYYFVYLKQLAKEKKFLKLFKEAFFAKDIIFNYLIIRLIEKIGIKEKINQNLLLNQEFAKRYQDEKFAPTDDFLKKRLIEDIFENSLPALLRYEDKNSMRFSIEGRVPFLDFNLLRYLFSLSDEAIIKNGWNKFILREAIKNLVPDLIRKRRNKIGFTTPEKEWFLRMKNRIYQIFLSEKFKKRPYFNQEEVLKAFQKFIEGKVDETMIFWRFLNLELWLRMFFDKEKEGFRKVDKGKKIGMANEGKKLIIQVEGKKYWRFPIKTPLFKKGDDFVLKISQETLQYFKKLKSIPKYQKIGQKKWFLVVAEKIIAVSQGRSYFLWEIKPGFWAKLLSSFVKKTPWGIGLGSPWTMQLAINEVGLPRILLSAFISAITKPFGISGLFYRIAGGEIASIDGPTEYSLYPSNVSAKLGPKNPKKVAEEIHREINSKFEIQNFQGVVIIDANDLGQKVLANSTNLENSLIEKMFKDNPMGQADEQTPLVVVFEE